MRKLTATLIVTAAILGTGSLTWKAGAATWQGASSIRTTAANQTLIQQVACWPGQRDGCPYHMKLGRYVPCVPCRHGPGY